MTVAIEGQLLFAGAADAGAMAGIMRAALARLIEEGLRYFREEEHDLHRAPAAADARLAGKGVMLEDDRSPYLLMLEPRHAPKERYHFITILSGSDLDEDEVSTEWSRLCLRLTQLTEAVRPTAAIGWGRPTDSEARPRSAKLALGGAPLDIGPWTYLSDNLVDDATARLLAGLSGICQNVPGGAIITPAPLPGAPIDADVARRFAEIPGLRLFDPIARPSRRRGAPPR